MRAFLGFGLLRPFQRDGRSDFAAGGDEALICSAGQISRQIDGVELLAMFGAAFLVPRWQR